MIDFPFTKEIILENSEVLLRPLTRDDFELLADFSVNEPELWHYSLQPADGLENLKTYINAAILGRENNTAYPFLVIDKHTNLVAGCTRFYDVQPQHSTTQLGFTWYGKKFQSTNLNKNCKLLLLTFAFETLGLQRVEFRADNNNLRSIAAMKSIGCTMEGVLRNNCASPTGRRDSIVLSILKDEWFGGVKKGLQNKIHAFAQTNK